MGIDPLTLGLAMGGASLASSLIGGVTANAQNRAQAEARQAQARQLRQQASLQEQQGRVEQEALDKQKAQLRRQYEETRGANRVALGQGNVDPASGSALQIADANAAAFAQDIGETAYMKALKAAETRNLAAASRSQANSLDALASWQKRAASSLAPTLIGALTSGASGFMTGYSWGGKFSGGKKR